MELSKLRVENVRLKRENKILNSAVGSGDQCNTLWGTVKLEGDRDGTHGTFGLVYGPESGTLAPMETEVVVERDRPGTRLTDAQMLVWIRAVHDALRCSQRRLRQPVNGRGVA